jgi:hypothetical protein
MRQAETNTVSPLPMPSHSNTEVWQDVYKPTVGGLELYVKFTLDGRGELLLISFKENQP